MSIFNLKQKANLAKNVITKTSPLYVQFYITARCNLACEQCNIIYADAKHQEMNIKQINQVAENLKKISISVEDATKKSRFGQSVKIIAVTKTFGPEVVIKALKSGVFCFGENKVQEAEKKLKNNTIKNKIKLHLIGHLQTNKVKKAVNLFDVIQTVDSIKLIKKIDKEAKKIQKKQNIYIQINIGDDKTEK